MLVLMQLPQPDTRHQAQPCAARDPPLRRARHALAETPWLVVALPFLEQHERAVPQSGGLSALAIGTLPMLLYLPKAKPRMMTERYQKGAAPRQTVLSPNLAASDQGQSRVFLVLLTAAHLHRPVSIQRLAAAPHHSLTPPRGV